MQRLYQIYKRDSIMYEMDGYVKFLSPSQNFIKEMTRHREETS